MSLSTCLLEAWALASGNREEGNEGAVGGDWEGVVVALHAISFTLCRSIFKKTCTSFTKPSGL